jgi:hypothetical protein
LFNVGADGQISIRKASAHGLGHLLAPYEGGNAPPSIPEPEIPLNEIGVKRWQYDLWHQIIRAALDGHPDQIDLNYHLNLNLPAASRYGATTPNLLGWFDKHNEARFYSGQVRPSNFLLAYQVSPVAIHECPELLASISDASSFRPRSIKLPKPVAPFDRNPANAAEACFDRDTGIAVPARVLKTYKDALAQYHLRPEHKFQNGNYRDRGITTRRHVKAAAVRNIGKESNRWQEQFYLGNEDGAEIDYGKAPDDEAAYLDAIRAQIVAVGQRKIARDSGISRRTISRFVEGKEVRTEILGKITGALQARPD